MLDGMALALDLWQAFHYTSLRLLLIRRYRSALLLGILYLTFQAFPIIFGEKHHFPPQFVGLTFIGMGVGMLIGLAIQPLFNRYAPIYYTDEEKSQLFSQLSKERLECQV